MDTQKQQLIERLQGATNILVTVSNNPTVDQLAACIGLTLLLNEAGKRATAVYSGDAPSTIQFLQPQATLEKTTDSLRDFIISLDIAKADKLRYKKDGPVVKIFITPYKTSLSSDDLVFEQGDFNIDVILGLGVHSQEELDQAITAHGRILHDATVMTINNTPNGQLGSVNWQDLTASSLSEQVASLASSFDKLKLDEQTATALLTGIVAETERFSNQKTTAATMSLAASLMAAGANQQLVAAELERPEPTPEPEPVVEEPAAEEPVIETPQEPTPEPEPEEEDGLVFTNDHIQEEPAEPAVEEPKDTVHITDDGHFSLPQPAEPEIPDLTFNDTPFTASGQSEEEDTSTDPFSQPVADQPLLEHDVPTMPQPVADNGAPAFPTDVPTEEPELTLPPRPAQAEFPQISRHHTQTLDEIEYASRTEEEAEQAAELAGQPQPGLSTTDQPVQDVDSARDAVNAAVAGSVNQPLEPIAALNAQPFGDPLTPQPEQSQSATVNAAVADNMQGNPQPLINPAALPTMDMPLPPVSPQPPQVNADNKEQPGPNSPPQVPPPFMPGANL